MKMDETVETNGETIQADRKFKNAWKLKAYLHCVSMLIAGRDCQTLTDWNERLSNSYFIITKSQTFSCHRVLIVFASSISKCYWLIIEDCDGHPKQVQLSESLSVFVFSSFEWYVKHTTFIREQVHNSRYMLPYACTYLSDSLTTYLALRLTIYITTYVSNYLVMDLST